VGIRVAYQPAPFDHTKVFSVDRAWSLVGSPNLDPRSLRLNFELGLEVYDEALAEGLAKHFDDRWARSQVLSMGFLDGRSIPVRLRDGIAKLMSPFL
jgi:cardiolipin synthase